MAANATESGEQVDKLSIRVLVDKEKNKVVFAEAGKDFVDALFSFLTLPLGTIARLVAKQSSMQSVNIGSLSSLYQSVADLKEEHLWTQTCKEMLLNPRNSTEGYCSKMKLNIDDTPMNYFFCSDWINCGTRDGEIPISTFKNKKCSCGKVMDKVLPVEGFSLGNGFVEETASFIIYDDLHVIPNALGTSIHLLQKLGVHNIDSMEEQIVHISKKEVVDLLMLAMLSKTPLTDLILKKKQFNSRNLSEIDTVEVPSGEGKQMSVKVTVRKSTGDILFVEGEEDFIDLLFSFLTFPLGGVLHMLEASSSITCMDNLYRSLNVLSPNRYLRSQAVKDILNKPQCFPKFELENQILPIGVASIPIKSCFFVKGYYVHKIRVLEPSSYGGFAKGPSLYIVTDNLVVTPLSSVSALRYLNESKVPLFDFEERVVKIGPKEGLCLLKACLISSSALTLVLKQFTRTVKEEQ